MGKSREKELIQKKIKNAETHILKTFNELRENVNKEK